MTEAEWLACTDSMPMLEYLWGKAGDRKLRLFACACCRRIWRLLSDERSRTAVQTAERYADGLAALPELTTAFEGANAAYRDGGDAFYGIRTDITPPHSVAPHGAAIHAANPQVWGLHGAANSAAHGVFINTRTGYSQADVNAAVIPERAAQAPLLRCIIGNPFRHSPPLPPAVLAWNDGTVRRIAVGIYEERAFDRLPILADALLDAGCDNEELLAHCRSDGPHVRGCWAVDLILGKS